MTFAPDFSTDFFTADFLNTSKYDKAVVSSSPLKREFFTLDFLRLRSADESSGLVWPFASTYFPGYSPLVWNANTNVLPAGAGPIFLDFTAVKKCTSKNEAELILRAKRAFGDNQRTYFSRFQPLVHLWKNERIMRSRSLPKSKSMEQDHRKKVCQSCNNLANLVASIF